MAQQSVRLLLQVTLLCQAAIAAGSASELGLKLKSLDLSMTMDGMMAKAMDLDATSFWHATWASTMEDSNSSSGIDGSLSSEVPSAALPDELQADVIGHITRAEDSIPVLRSLAAALRRILLIFAGLLCIACFGAVQLLKVQGCWPPEPTLPARIGASFF